MNEGRGMERLFPALVPYKFKTPPKLNSSPLKNDGWKTMLSFWGRPKFLRGERRAFKLQRCTLPEINIATENGWLECWLGAMLVSGRVICSISKHLVKERGVDHEDAILDDKS